MRGGSAPADATASAVWALAREVVLNRSKVSEATLAATARAGLSEEAVLEVVLECARAVIPVVPVVSRPLLRRVSIYNLT